eukprot:TRINITY_DN5521_c0_g1_i1.p1 TRINITY_DN5521_c0_g1~~TRINITY_DN5521_c0_g1_i1.p1  ORF type:complete len:397 (+),score=121.79 TRINITY_DN5521_c0_g1_i1:83-1273(+)
MDAVLIAAAVAVVLFVLAYRSRPRAHPAPREPRGAADCHEAVSWAAAMQKCPRTGVRYLVVGCGFVGRRVVEVLLERGEGPVRVFDVMPNPFPGDDRVEYIRGDVTKRQQLLQACDGIDTVYSTFAVIRFMDRSPALASLSEKVNIEGTENLLAACQQAGVRYLVYTSTSHVSVTPSRARYDMTEEDPLVDRRDAHNHYTWTKAAAEKAVLAADGERGLRTVAVRPCSGVFGATDKVMLEPALKQKFAVLIYPRARIDYVYVDNVVYGHLLAEQALRSGAKGVGGEAFCVSNGEPVYAEDLYVALTKYAPEVKLVFAPKSMMWVLAYITELLVWFTGDRIKLGDLRMLTPAMMNTAAMSYTFDCSKAKKVLGYEPVYSFDQACAKTVADFRRANSG